MRKLRRLFGYVAAVLMLAVSNTPFAQEWKPTRDVEFVVPFAVGGGADIMARVIHKIITEQKLVPVPIAINNRPGGGGAVGIGYVSASRKADPHTLILINGSTQITPIMTPNARTLSEVQPVMNVMLDDFVFFVKGDAPWKTVADFVKDAKSKPPKTYNFAAGGPTDAMALSVLSKATGVEYNNVQFNSGGEAITALLGGHVNASLGNPLEFMGHLKSGAVRAIGVFRQTRFSALSNVPTLKEQGINTPDFQMWRGVAIPKDSPNAAARYWEGVMQKVVASAEFKKYLQDNVASEAPIAGKAFENYLATQEKLYRDLLAK